METVTPDESPVKDLKDAGYLAYWRGLCRSELATEDEKLGWDDAYGEDCYYRAMYEEDQIGYDESTMPYLF